MMTMQMVIGLLWPLGLVMRWFYRFQGPEKGAFYPVLLGIIRKEEEERNKLVSVLYTKGLTTEDISEVWEKLYGKTYTKGQISNLMRETKKEVNLWLERRLDKHYLVLYIDATFVHTRRDESVSKEAYYSILGVKTDGTREVLAVVNHPTEGATNWENELNNLKTRGLETTNLVVSDALTGIENAVAKAFRCRSSILSRSPQKTTSILFSPKIKRRNSKGIKNRVSSRPRRDNSL